MKPLLLLLSLLLGDEQIVTTPSIGLSGFNYGPSVAASSTNYLAAWLVRPPQNPRLPGRIAVRPFSNDGAQSPTEILLDDAFGAPGVGSNGDDYLLAWSVDGAITVRRVAKNGTPIDAARTLTPSLSQGQLPVGDTTRVLWNGSHYVVVTAASVYVQGFIKSSVEVAFVDTDRHLVAADNELLQDAATVPGLTLALSTKSQALNGRFIDDAGNVSAPVAITSDPVLLAAAASDGTSFLVAWLTSTFELRAARVGPSGSVSPAVTIAANVVYGPPVLRWNGGEFGLAWWSAPSSVKYAVVTESGASAPRTIPALANALALTGANGVSALVVSYNVMHAVLIRGNTTSNVALAEVVLDQWAPRRIGDALYYLEGTLGTMPSLIRQSAAGRGSVIDAVGYDADDNAVAWIDGQGRAGIVMRVPNGTVSRAFPADGTAIAMASDGVTRLLAFRRGSAVWTLRVGADGTVLDQVQLSSGSAFPANIHAVWRGDDFLVEWQEDRAVKSALLGDRRAVIDFTLPEGAVVHNVAASRGKTAVAWSVDSELHLGSVDPEAPSAGPVVAREEIRSAAVFAVPSGFDVEWLTPNDAVAAAGEIVWASPRLILYSKGSVIAQRAVAKARRRVAAAP